MVRHAQPTHRWCHAQHQHGVRPLSHNGPVLGAAAFASNKARRSVCIQQKQKDRSPTGSGPLSSGPPQYAHDVLGLMLLWTTLPPPLSLSLHIHIHIVPWCAAGRNTLLARYLSSTHRVCRAVLAVTGAPQTRLELEDRPLASTSHHKYR